MIKFIDLRLLCLFLLMYPALTLASEIQISDAERDLVNATNREREKAGLAPLTESPMLFEAARDHSTNMAKQKTLSHVLDGKSVEDRIKAQRYRYFEVGENIAWNDPNPVAAVNAWMNSPPHRANILNKDFTEIGVGIAKDDEGHPYYTQDFGRPQSAGPTARATITVFNKTGNPIRVSIPGNDSASVIEPDGEGQLSVSGMGTFPPAQVQMGQHSQNLPLKDGAKYTIRTGEHGLSINSTESVH